MVMDRVEFSNKLANLISSGGYYKVKKDPTLKTERRLSQTLCKNKCESNNKDEDSSLKTLNDENHQA